MRPQPIRLFSNELHGIEVLWFIRDKPEKRMKRTIKKVRLTSAGDVPVGGVRRDE